MWLASHQSNGIFGGFSDPFLSLQLAVSPSNGNCLTTDGTNNTWGSCGGAGSSSTFGTTSISALFPIAWDTTLAQIGFSGLGTSSAAVRGNIPYFSRPNTFANVATGTIGASGGITVTAGQSIIGSGLTVGCTAASAGATGCLSSTDWSTFNTKPLYDWIKQTNYNVLSLTPSTTIPVWFKDQIFASSSLIAAGTITADRFIATNTTATSTFGFTTAGRIDSTGNATNTAAQGFNITNGCYAINGICIGGAQSHAALSNLAWTSSGHTGTANTIPYFSNSGAAIEVATSSLNLKLSSTIILSATTTLGTGTTSLPFSGFVSGRKFTQMGCTSNGSGTFVAQLGDSTSSSTPITSGTGLTTTFIAISSNNVFTAGEKVWVGFSLISGTVSYPSCSFEYLAP